MSSKSRFVNHPAWSLCACVGAFAPSVAWAQSEHPYAFAIQPKAAAEALIDFAVQANISIGGVNACRGRSPGLKGRYTIEAGLNQLLAKIGCGFRRVALDTVQVFPEAPARPPAGSMSASARTTPPPIPMVETSPVVVTSTKRAAVIGSLPYAITALGHDQLIEAGAQDIGDVAAQIPGLSTTNLGLGRDKILLRGLSDGVFTGRTQSTVGIYLDDVPITYNAPDPDLQLADVEAVEVLRGPQGALYGGGAMSGVYHIVTRKPELNDWSGYARVGGSLTQLGAPSEEYEGMLNAPLVRDRLAARAVAYETIEGGYIDATDLRQSNVDQTIRKGARAALRGQLGNDWVINVSLGFQSIRSNDAQYVTPGGGRLHRSNQILESSRNNFSQSALSAERSESWGQFKSTTAFVQHKFSSQSDASNALPLFGSGTTAAGSYEEPIDVQMLTEDAVFTSPNIGRFQWLAGAYASATWETTDPLVRAGVPPSGNAPSAQTLYSEHRTDQRAAGALYGDASYALTDRLTATAGLRASSSNAVTTSIVLAPQQGQRRLFSGQITASGWAPKVALAYKLSQNNTLYVLASEGGRSPGFNTGGPIGATFSTSANASGMHRQFGADRLWNLEAGVKLSALDGRLSLNADLFYDLWRNIQTDQFLASGLSYTANAGDGRNLGSEVDLVARPFNGFTLQATALLNRPELIHANPGFMSGVNLPGVPDVSLGGRAAYRWQVAEGFTALVSTEAQYIGRSHLTFDPNASPTMGGYVLARFSAQVEHDGWRLAMFLSNPANARGNTFSYGNPFDFQQAQEVTPERPRTLRAVLSKEF